MFNKMEQKPFSIARTISINQPEFYEQIPLITFESCKICSGSNLLQIYVCL